MSNPYIYNNYQQSSYSPPLQNGSLSNTSPTFNYVGANNGSLDTSSTTSSLGSSLSSTTSSMSSSAPSNYSFHTPRLRYYLSKSFDIEDDMEFCPDIPDNLPAGLFQSHNSPPQKKFNPYTASVFSPTATHGGININDHPPSPNSAIVAPSSPRVHTPRIKKPLEIINPQTKLRVGSPAIHK